MPMSLRFTELSERQAETKAGVRSPSKSDVDFVLRRCAPIDRPIDVVRALKSAGLGLAEAHKLLNRIVADEVVALRLDRADRAATIAELAELGVAAE